jgi:Tfp pilus assembly protein PilN
MTRLLPQSGIGIEWRGDVLCAVYARRFWNRVRILDSLEIPNAHALGAVECGLRYREFLRQNGLKSPWTVVALPRAQVLVRSLRFPGGMEKELGAAVALQLDALHPFQEGGVSWDFAIRPDEWGGSGAETSLFGSQKPIGGCNVLVGITPRATVEQWATWFEEAGIPVSQFTLSSTLLLTALGAALRKQSPASAPFFILHVREDGCELLGRAEGRPALSRAVSWPEGATEPETQAAVVWSELDLARSELRLEPATRPALLVCGAASQIRSALQSAEVPWAVASVEPLLPPAKQGLAGFSPAENILGVLAAALAAELGPRLPMNLLPTERRSYESTAALVPTFALASLIVLLAMAIGLRGNVQDWVYGRRLERERQSLAPQIQEIERLQGSSRDKMAHLAALARYQQSGALPLGMLDELTRILPADAWLQQFQYEGNAVTLSGTAPSASSVLQALSASNYLESPQFSASLTRTADGKEVFRIGARLRVPNP